MDKSVIRICLILAGADLSSRDIHEFCRWLDAHGPMSLESTIKKIRTLASDAAIDEQVPLWIDHRIGHNKNAEITNYEVANDIARLLLREAGLPVAKAAELLRLSVEKYFDRESTLPKIGKKSFKDWIVQLSDRIANNKLLHEATRIRNQYVNTRKGDWPLRKGNES